MTQRVGTFPGTFGRIGVVQMWWRREDSNLRHGAYETPALPPELRRRAGGRAENLQAYGAGVKRARGSLGGHCARHRARKPPSDLLEIAGAHDVAAVEHRASLVAGHGHGYALGHPRR